MRREEILSLECERTTVHSFLTQFPNDIDIERLIENAQTLYAKYPPEKLQKDSRIYVGPT